MCTIHTRRKIDRRGRRSDHGDVTELQPVRPGWCDYCGGRLPKERRKPGMRFCATACRTEWWRMARVRGGQLYQFLVLWRMHRGGKNTPGAGKLGEIAAKVDAFIADDRAAGLFKDG